MEIIARICITINFCIRSTSLITWPLIFLYRLSRDRTHSLKTKLFINFMHAVLSLIFTLLLDYSYYGNITCSAYNFVMWNVVTKKSIYFVFFQKLILLIHHQIKLLLSILIFLIYHLIYNIVHHCKVCLQYIQSIHYIYLFF